MATLTTDTPRDFSLGEFNDVPVIASEIIYEGAAVGMVEASGHARPLVGGDKFVGMCTQQADNSSGAAAAINVRVLASGQASLSVSGAVITDLGQPVYATDDNVFVFLPTGGTFIGYVARFVSAGVVIVKFNTEWKDPYGGGVYETLSANKTFDVEDTGKTFFIDTDATTTTLPAVATPVFCKVVNIGAYGTVAVNLSPQAADMIEGPDITAANDKDLINTKATAQRGDYAVLGNIDADGYMVTELVGTWAREA